MKTTISLVVLFVLILGGGYAWSQHQSQGSESTGYQPAAVSTASSTSTDSTVATSTQTVSNASYTLAQVSGHATSKDCWAAIDGNVYNLTSWVSQHPGGEARILEICGKDGSQAFGGQHGRDTQAQSVLATFKIGTLAS